MLSDVLQAMQIHVSQQVRYSGILAKSPNLQEAQKAYLTYCHQKDFPFPDQVRLVSKTIKGPGLNFWMEKINWNVEYTERGAFFKTLEVQLVTFAHQKKIEALASSLTMEDMIKRHDLSRFAALEMLYHEFSCLNAQLPNVYRGPSLKCQTLMRIVDRYEWSCIAEGEVMQDEIAYDALYSKLSASIFICECDLFRSGKRPEQESDQRISSTSVPFLVRFGKPYIHI